MRCILSLFALLAIAAPACAELVSGFRPPSIPIIVLSPTMSMWVNADKLTDDWAHHWSGGKNTMAMAGMARIDGKAYSFMGVPPNVGPMSQDSLTVYPTQTVASFSAAGVQLNLTFSQSAFPQNLELYARPLAYITVSVGSMDGNKHDVQVYLDHASDVLVNDFGTLVDWSDVSKSMASTSAAGAKVLKMGTYDQIPYMNRGDGVKNEWGHVYFATNSARVKTAVQAFSNDARAAFIANTDMPATDDHKPRPASSNWPGSVFVLDFGSVTTVQSDYFVFAFDDVQSMYYFHQQQKPYWRQIFADSVSDMLAKAFSDYSSVISACNTADASQIAAMTKASGPEYATIGALVHRQTTGATILTWNDERKEVWAYMKEISSDGDISTVDVIFPASPFFVLQGPELLRLTLLPVLAYGMNETDIKYRLPWAPHHLGEWPVADIIGDQQEQMPMEESANMLIMLAGIAQQQSNKVDWLKPYWPALQTWAEYLNSSLPDPGNQLCTDDFEGASPHNVNLALKGTLGLASYSLLLKYNGQSDAAAQFMSYAENFAQDWLKMGVDKSGDHFKLQFDLENTWSTKYNLMWQYALGLNIFPQSVADNEVAWYLSHPNPHGIPLDSRGPLVKCDWLSWAAAFASKKSDADALLKYIYDFANTTPSRVPLTDYYDSKQNTQIGFQARPVMGGWFARLLVLSNGHMPTAMTTKSE